MSQNPFGFEPEDLDRLLRQAGDNLRDALGRVSRQTGWSVLFDEFTRATGPAAAPETTGEIGDGVWVIYSVDGVGGARIEEVYRTELDALRANRNNTDPGRRVRFLPYGIAVGVLDGE
jgi:hypothetical protein